MIESVCIGRGRNKKSNKNPAHNGSVTKKKRKKNEDWKIPKYFPSYVVVLHHISGSKIIEKSWKILKSLKTCLNHPKWS